MTARRTRVLLLAAAIGAALLPTVAAAAAPARSPMLLHTAVAMRQDVAPQNGCENDTVVEPDVAVSPKNRNVAIAVAHDCRFADGGAVDISVAWTANAGADWHHFPAPRVTKATGGRWDRASDPVVTFGPDGTAYLSILVFDTAPCPNSPSGVLVLTSRDGGKSWSRPHLAHYSATCKVSDDKNWIVVDRSPASRHFGRVYQFWTPYLSKDAAGTHFVGAPQAVRWSDDHGRTWSKTVFVTPRRHDTQNSQPMITSTGVIVDTYYDYGAVGRVPDLAPGTSRSITSARIDAARAIVDNEGPVYAARSANGGATWKTIAEVTNAGYGYAQNVRCCLFAADVDRSTGYLYVAFEGAGVQTNTDPVYVSVSRDGGFLWTNPVQVSRGDVAGVQRVNVDVVARRGSVYVTYGTRTRPREHGGYVQQQLSVSRNRGASFGAPLSLGPRSVLRYAAHAGGYFPGDYVGEAIARGRLYAVWAVSSKPPATSTSRYHQVIYAATLRPRG